jgi:tetratricopeptide (TPR) repeat protein
LQFQAEDLSKVINRPVHIWGPIDGVPEISPSDVESRTTTLRANLLVYGTIERMADGNWLLQPAFYLSDAAAQNTSAELAGELQGSHALGKSIRYSPSAELQGDANAEIQRRMEALRLLVRGLLYFAQESAEGYAKALGEFEAATETEWGQAEDNTGQEILYLFLGNGHFQQLSFAVQENASIDERRELIFLALDAYEKASSLNENYVRAFNGEAGGYVQLARLAQVGSGNTCGWDRGWLDEAAPLYQQVLDASPSLKQAGDDADLNAHLGLGRIAFIRSFCHQSDDWEAARSHFDAAIALYEAERRPSQAIKGIIAYRERGHSDFFDETTPLQAGSDRLQEVINRYRMSVDIGIARNREQTLLMARDSMIYLLEALCWDGQTTTLTPTLNDFLSHFSDQPPVREIIVDKAIFEDHQEECHNAISQP